MDSDLPISELVEQFRRGDNRAAELLFTRYAQRLTRLAEQHLSRKLAGRVAGEDVVQSVFRTFYRRSAQGEFRVDASAQLWQLLAKITLLKARAVGRRHTAGLRDVAAEQAGEVSPEALAHEPGPEEAAALADEVDALLAGLPTLAGQVLELRLAGYHVVDVAAQLQVCRQTVHRVLNLLQDRLQAQKDALSVDTTG